MISFGEMTTQRSFRVIVPTVYDEGYRIDVDVYGSFENPEPSIAVMVPNHAAHILPTVRIKDTFLMLNKNGHLTEDVYISGTYKDSSFSSWKLSTAIATHPELQQVTRDYFDNLFKRVWTEELQKSVTDKLKEEELALLNREIRGATARIEAGKRYLAGVEKVQQDLVTEEAKLAAFEAKILKLNS